MQQKTSTQKTANRHESARMDTNLQTFTRASTEGRRIEQGLHAERRLVQRTKLQFALGDPQAGEALLVPAIQVAVGCQRRLLPTGRKHAQAAIIMMAVTLDMFHTQQGHERQVLE